MITTMFSVTRISAACEELKNRKQGKGEEVGEKDGKEEERGNENGRGKR